MEYKRIALLLKIKFKKMYVPLPFNIIVKPRLMLSCIGESSVRVRPSYWVLRMSKVKVNIQLLIYGKPCWRISLFIQYAN